MEEVKDSSNNKTINKSIPAQMSIEASEQRKNFSRVGKETSLGSRNRNMTTKREKNSETGYSTSPNVSVKKSAPSLPKETDHFPITSQEMEVKKYTEETNNSSLGNARKKLERNLDRQRAQQNMRDSERTQQVSQNLDKHVVEGNQANATQVSARNRTELNYESPKATPNVRDTSRGLYSNSIKQPDDKTRRLHETKNGDNIPLNMNVPLKKIVKVKEPNKVNNTVEKSKQLEKVKINFMEKNKRSHVKQNDSHIFRIGDLNAQRKSQSLENESNSKTDLEEKPVTMSQSDQLSWNGNEGTDVLDKVVLGLDKTDAISKSSKDEQIVQKDREHFHNEAFESSSRNSSTSTAKSASEEIFVHLNGNQKTSKDNKSNNTSERIVVRLNGKQEASKDNKTNNSSERTVVHFSGKREASKGNKMNRTSERTVAHLSEKQVASKNIKSNRTSDRIAVHFNGRQKASKGNKTNRTSERIVVHLNGKQEASKNNKTSNTSYSRIVAHLNEKQVASKDIKTNRTSERIAVHVNGRQEASKDNKTNRNSERIVVHLNGKQEASKNNKTSNTSESRIVAHFNEKQVASKDIKSNRTSGKIVVHFHGKQEASKGNKTNRASEGIVVHFNGKQEESKKNKTNVFVNVGSMLANGNGDQRTNATSDSSEKDKIATEKFSIKRSHINETQRDTGKELMVDSDNAKSPHVGSDHDQTENNVNNSVKLLGKDKKNTKVQEKKIGKILDNSSNVLNYPALVAKVKTLNDHSSKKKALDNNEETSHKSERSKTSVGNIVGKEKANPTKVHVEFQNLQKSIGGSHEGPLKGV